MTALAKPAVGATVVDPQFGTTIRRISGAGTGNIIKPAYSTIPAWNADESLMVLYHSGSTVKGGSGHHLYNGKTYSYIRALDIDPADIEQFYWHATNPDWLMYVNGSNQLIRYHVSTGAKEVVRSFACSSQVSGGTDPMYTSWNSDVIGLACGTQGFTFKLSTNTESPRATVIGDVAPIASASGNSVFVAENASEVRDLNMRLLRTFNVEPYNHASLGRLANGTDTHNSVSFDSPTPGSLVVSDMSGLAAPRVIVGPATGWPYPPSGTHVSALALKNPGWVGVSIVGTVSGANTLDQEVLLSNTNAGGSTCRVAHHRSYGKDGSIGYMAEPHVVVSPRGTRLLFGSDWGNGGSVDAYVVELPSYQP